MPAPHPLSQWAETSLQPLIKLIRYQLWAQILLALALGLVVGTWLSPEGGRAVSPELAYSLAEWIKLPGTLFLNLIQMVVIPLVISSIVLGVSSGSEGDALQRLGIRIAPYFVLTTTVAVTIGISLALLIQPGNYVDVDALMSSTPVAANTDTAVSARASLPQHISNLIPTNVTRAISEQSMLQLVIFSIFVGLALASIPRKRIAALRDVVEGVQEVSMKVVSWAMLLAPYAVFGLIADIAIRVGLDVLLGMSAYVGTVILGLFSLYLSYLLIIKVLAQRSVIQFAKAIRPAQLLAFSTSSSAAVMPLSLQTAQQDLQIDESTARFVIPLGATINMDGTALYQVIAAVFLAQVFGVEMELHQIILLAVTTVGASIGSPSTPGVGIVILATVLTSVGIPAEGIALILGVDRILDMCRTAVNVSGDLVACCVMQRWV
ncbi:dicarboxylate/amino acid:cation symporter [Bacterioplanes sanyensis]|uniref:dicarboxylate/amino acid:cation symporter n=1 Tax=Bacterioplanes sanyensis TaxID=1249553 RepID=UPI00167ACB8F|nr:dicarboxylate/amino acid:cation symporter [Bacterioplanes sanyensis]GGY56343.1 dicarboxylate/amino acid:cation symporter [Bacterioplanes sanyensis]